MKVLQVDLLEYTKRLGSPFIATILRMGGLNAHRSSFEPKGRFYAGVLRNRHNDALKTFATASMKQYLEDINSNGMADYVVVYYEDCGHDFEEAKRRRHHLSLLRPEALRTFFDKRQT